MSQWKKYNRNKEPEMMNTQLCDELDRSALTLVYDKWRGNPINPAQFKLALANLASYGLYLSPDAIFSKRPDPAPTFAAHSEEETEAAFKSLLSPPQGGDAAQKIGDGTFLKFIMPIVLKLLAGFLV